jgi:hypothetical protein
MRPPKRSDLPARHSDNDKRRLHPAPDRMVLEALSDLAAYGGISKHKAEPLRFGLPPHSGPRGDATLCDEHAGFEPSDLPGVRMLLVRGIAAGLVGHVERHGIPTIVWTVSDHGWIFEARVTNVRLAEYHGYPVRPSEAIAEQVIGRFTLWARKEGTDADRRAAENCRALYGIPG